MTQITHCVRCGRENDDKLACISIFVSKVIEQTWILFVKCSFETVKPETNKEKQTSLKVTSLVCEKRQKQDLTTCLVLCKYLAYKFGLDFEVF